MGTDLYLLNILLSLGQVKLAKLLFFPLFQNGFIEIYVILWTTFLLAVTLVTVLCLV